MRSPDNAYWRYQRAAMDILGFGLRQRQYDHLQAADFALSEFEPWWADHPDEEALGYVAIGASCIDLGVFGQFVRSNDFIVQLVKELASERLLELVAEQPASDQLVLLADMKRLLAAIAGLPDAIS